MNGEAVMEPGKTGLGLAITIAEDGMGAFALLSADAPVPSPDDVREALAHAGIRHGVLEESLGKIGSGRALGTPLLVASGTPAVNGEDGRIEWLFSPPPGVKALLRNTACGQKIARLVPPGQGVPGKSVLGQPVPPVPGNPASLHRGPHTAADPADPSLTVATVGGNIVVSDGKIEVQPVLIIPGQIDYSDGNIEFDGSLVVQGDIRGEVTIKVKGSLTVKGSIEDAEIEAGGDVVVEKGFVGRGKGRITAGGNVSVLHVLNQTIVAGKDVHIGHESVNGSVCAGGSLKLPAAVIAGGTLRADVDIVVNTIGSTDGVGAKVHAGRRGRILERIPVVEREAKQAAVQVVEIKDAVYRLVRIQIDSGSLDAEKQETLRKLQAAQKLLPARIAALNAELEALKESLKKNQEVSVTVRETVFEHTLVEINGAKKMVEAALQGVIFRERNGAIEVSSC